MSNYPRDEFDAVEENSARHGVHRALMEPHRSSLMPLMIFGVVALCVGLVAFFIMPKMFNTTSMPLVGVSTSGAPLSTQPTPASAVDKNVPVDVFNATGIPGLAAQYAGRVTSDGWPVGLSANWAGAPQAASVVFYSGIKQKANAEALSVLLNIPAVAETTELGLSLAVVLGPGT
ncbi:LytR C-terminal domain-containing protein [Arthrobacter sp.]|uniref:LytR C-terminal domain-containing protein n=1 Tax=Arthrobacter sp. TaxID=1667 RepID=UPI0026DF7573|nr:LytR C-terminal domain-containing protein [Arthrobacter sp.]MDO5753545.1 LytR C-terminal domain-containing protein [Arthrobacter sp.]